MALLDETDNFRMPCGGTSSRRVIDDGKSSTGDSFYTSIKNILSQGRTSIHYLGWDLLSRYFLL